MKVVIAGKNNIAVNVAIYILEQYPEIELFSIVNRTDTGIDGFQRSFMKFCQQSEIPMISLEDAYSLHDSIFLSLEFDRIVNPDLFSHKKIYNIHFSFLPKYKGMYTSAWPIINGESASGITLHKIDRGIDTGDIIDQFEFKLDKNETAKTLYLKYINHGINLVIDNFDRILDREVEGTQQGSINSSYYSKKSIDYANLKFDFNKTAFEISNQIKAFTFRDYQLPNISGNNIFGVKVTNKKSNRKPGELVFENDEELCFSTIDFDIYLYKDVFDQFLFACETGDYATVYKLSKNEQLINEKNIKGWSPIIVATYNGHIEIIKLLLQKGASINDQNNKGTTVLMYAKDYLEKTGDISFIQNVIDFGADCNLKDYKNYTVKDYVAQSGNQFSKEFFSVF